MPLALLSLPRRSIPWLLTLAACGPDVGPGMDGTSSATGSSSSTTDQATTLDGSSSGAAESTGIVDSTGGLPSAIDAHIEAWCQAWLTPECPLPRYDSLEECIDHYTARLQPWIDAAAAGELGFDEQCGADQVAALLGEATCNALQCSLFVGTAGEGEACEPLEVRLASQCDADTLCHSDLGTAGTCVPRCVVFGVGDDCGYGQVGTCEDGTQCILDGDTPFAGGVCEPLPGPGDPCANTESPCGFDMWCDNGVCSDQFGGSGDSCLDQPCDAAQTYCEMDVCEALLPDGSPCMRWWNCASGACVGDVCVPLPDTVGEPCHQEKVCGGGLQCNGLLFTCQEPFAAIVCNWQQWCPVDAGFDGVCNEGDGPDDCPPDSDAADCGYCPAARQGDGTCDEPLRCAPGTDPDC